MDFKVGDVVRGEYGEGSIIAIVGATDHDPLCYGIRVRYADGTTRCCCFPQDISLVSRPSEAKPGLKVGDLVQCTVALLGLGRIERINHETAEVSWRAGGHNTFPSVRTLRKVSEFPPPSPALKVGDRVRITLGNMATKTGVIDSISGEAVDVRLETGGLFLTFVKALELLLPEPAKPIADEFEWLANKKPYQYHKPMTATQASMLARNQTDPMRDPEYTHELDAMRYQMQNLIDQETLRSFQTLPPAVEPETSGWMPAGTYMPTATGLRMTAQEQKLAHQLIAQSTRHLMFAPSGWRHGESGPGISASIPIRHRRLSSQTLSWSNLGDDYDLLPDAD